MNRLMPAFEGHEVVFACTNPSYHQNVPEHRFYAVPEASANEKFALIWQALKVFLLLLRIRPNMVLTTGASAGYFALLFGKKLGMKTAWVDSIANVDEISRSGLLAAKHADFYITQWEHLAQKEGPLYFGSVI